MYESAKVVICPVGEGFRKVVDKALSKTVTGMAGGKTKKMNQDSHFVVNNFMGLANQVFLGVMDGHGLYGGQISNYVKNALPYHMSTLLNPDCNL
jgi:serine/threonine protein phosphatase PrpC